jgi:hypothetical protein
MVSGLVQPCIMGPIAPFAVAWFAAGERDLAITLCGWSPGGNEEYLCHMTDNHDELLYDSS